MTTQKGNSCIKMLSSLCERKLVLEYGHIYNDLNSLCKSSVKTKLHYQLI